MRIINIIAKVFVGVILLAGLILAGLNFHKLIEEKGSMKRARISGYTFNVEKQVLANGECYYVYVAGSKSFVIPCEEESK